MLCRISTRSHLCLRLAWHQRAMCSFVPCSHFLGCGNVARGRWRKGLKPLRRWEGQSARVSEGLGKAKVREQSGAWMLRAVLWVPRKCPRAPLWTGLRRGGQNCRPGVPRPPSPASPSSGGGGPRAECVAPLGARPTPAHRGPAVSSGLQGARWTWPQSPR